MIDYITGTYSFEDSKNVPQFGRNLSIVELDVEAVGEEEVEMTKTREEEIEREMLLRKLSTRPTSCPQSICAEDFSALIDELRWASTMTEKANILLKHGVFVEVAHAILAGDEQTARRLIAKICA